MRRQPPVLADEHGATAVGEAVEELPPAHRVAVARREAEPQPGHAGDPARQVVEAGAALLLVGRPPEGGLPEPGTAVGQLVKEHRAGRPDAVRFHLPDPVGHVLPGRRRVGGRGEAGAAGGRRPAWPRARDGEREVRERPGIARACEVRRQASRGTARSCQPVRGPPIARLVVGPDGTFGPSARLGRAPISRAGRVSRAAPWPADRRRGGCPSPRVDDRARPVAVPRAGVAIRAPGAARRGSPSVPDRGPQRSAPGRRTGLRAPSTASVPCYPSHPPVSHSSNTIGRSDGRDRGRVAAGPIGRSGAQVVDEPDPRCLRSAPRRRL